MVTSIANSLGFGSGIDTAQIVADLAAASRMPKVEVFDNRLRAVQAKISAVAQARSDLESFATSLKELVASGTIQSQPTVSDAVALGAVASPGARIGNVSHEIEITQLARAQTVYSGGIASATDPIGQGPMTLTVGTQNFAITIDGTNDSLNGLVAAINATGSGVTASVVNDAGTSRLVLKGKSGAANAFTLQPGAGAAPGLSAFSYTPGGGALTLGQSAQDALLKVDGVAFVRNTNSINDIIQGMTLTLKKPVPGQVINVGSTRPTELLRQTLGDFVAVFNTLRKDVSAAISTTGGDAALRGLSQRLSDLLAQRLTSDPAINSLSSIGIATNRDGTIRLDSVRFEQVLRDNPDAVESILSPTRDATHTALTDPGIADALDTLRLAMTSSGGPLDALKQRLDKEVAALSKNRERMEARELAYKARLEKQFGQLDSRMSALKATQSYLDQQIKLWTRDS
jgi:flagellar hook-associated protein 2